MLQGHFFLNSVQKCPDIQGTATLRGQPAYSFNVFNISVTNMAGEAELDIPEVEVSKAQDPQ